MHIHGSISLNGYKLEHRGAGLLFYWSVHSMVGNVGGGCFDGVGCVGGWMLGHHGVSLLFCWSVHFLVSCAWAILAGGALMELGMHPMPLSCLCLGCSSLSMLFPIHVAAMCTSNNT